MYIFIAFIIVSIFVLFRIVNSLQNYLSLRKKTKHKLSFILPAAEFITWNIFFFWAVLKLYSKVTPLAVVIIGLLFILLLVIYWQLIKDFLFGIYYKSQNTIILEKPLKFESNEGIVIKTGNFSFELELKSGEIESIPYRLINNNIITYSVSNKFQKKIKLSFILPIFDNPEEITEKLKRILLNSPWVTNVKDVEILKTDQIKKEVSVSIYIYTINENYSGKIKQYVYNSLKNENIENFKY